MGHGGGRWGHVGGGRGVGALLVLSSLRKFCRAPLSCFGELIEILKVSVTQHTGKYFDQPVVIFYLFQNLAHLGIGLQVSMKQGFLRPESSANCRR